MKLFCLLIILYFGSTYCFSQQRGAIVENSSHAEFVTGNTYAVIIGISNYKYIRPLSFADQDALLFKEFLQSKAGSSVKEENILLFINDDAKASTQPRIRHWINDVKKPHKGDRVYFYFASHGDAINGDEYFFLLQDCNPSGDKNNYVGGMVSVLQMYNLKSFIKNSLTDKGVQVVMIWDACRTNELPGGVEGQKMAQQGIAERNNGEFMMLSASAGETALENNSYGHGHGLFTYYLIDGLSGAADKAEGGNNDGRVDMSELETYVKMQVRRDAKNKFNSLQNPKFIYNSDVGISKIDPQFSKDWALQKTGNETYAFQPPKTTRSVNPEIDTAISELYNNCMKAIKIDSIEEAETLVSKMESKYPKNNLTNDASFNLAMEYINLAQDKINFILSDFDEEIIDKNDRGSFQIRIQKTAERDFLTNAEYLKKSIEILNKSNYQDSLYIKQLNAKRNYFLAASVLETKIGTPDYRKALSYAYQSLKLQHEAAYNYDLIARIFDQNILIDSALIMAKQAVKLAPKWPSALNTVGYLYERSNIWDSAILYYKKEVQINPTGTRSYLSLAHLFADINKFDSSIDYCNKVLSINNKNTIILNKVGRYYIQMKKYDSARKYLNQAIFYDKQYADAYVDLGYIFEDLKQGDSAVWYYKKAVLVDANSMRAYNYLGWIYSHSLNKIDSAIYYYKAHILLDPKSSDYQNLLNNYLDSKQYDSVKKYAFKALEFQVNKSFSYGFLGEVYAHENMLDSAKYYFKESIKIDYKYNVFSIFELNRIYFKEKHIDSAVELTNGIFLKDKKVGAEVMIGLANLYWIRNNDFSNAEKYYFIAEKYSPKIAYYNLSCLYAVQNKVDKGIEFFEKSLKAGYNDFDNINVDKDLDSIRNNEKFIKLLKFYKKQ